MLRFDTSLPSRRWPPAVVRGPNELTYDRERLDPTPHPAGFGWKDSYSKGGTGSSEELAKLLLAWLAQMQQLIQPQHSSQGMGMGIGGAPAAGRLSGTFPGLETKGQELPPFSHATKPGPDPNLDIAPAAGRSKTPAATGGEYSPGSPEAIKLFQEAARSAGLPESWAKSRALHKILARESNGQVGRPNYTYGRRAKDPSQWGSVHAELKAGRITARSSATGLGQLLLSNVETYYPSGRAGIGNAHEEAVGMLKYIKDRYGSPERAWALYGKRHEGY
ncbi:MAG: hypothetical protein HYV07_15630 [Deltaproteobacteria bacterium]|nr:hypothetical protein [Deltaproteobacteria bacterium]